MRLFYFCNRTATASGLDFFYTGQLQWGLRWNRIGCSIRRNRALYFFVGSQRTNHDNGNRIMRGDHTYSYGYRFLSMFNYQNPPCVSTGCTESQWLLHEPFMFRGLYRHRFCISYGWNISLHLCLAAGRTNHFHSFCSLCKQLYMHSYGC